MNKPTCQTPAEQKARLNELSQALTARGVVDVKFAYSNVATLDVAAAEAIEILEAVLDGNHHPLFGLGDSTFPEVNARNAAAKAAYESIHGTI